MHSHGAADKPTQTAAEASSKPAQETTSPHALHSVVETGKEDDVSKQYNLVCQKRKDFLDNDPTVKFMLQKLEEV